MKFQTLLLMLKLRPVCKCPVCKGTGGKLDYWGEWYECEYCFPTWERLDTLDHECEWVIGRIGVYKYLKYKVGKLCCRYGWHSWSKTANWVHTNPPTNYKYCHRCCKFDEKEISDERRD